MITALKTNFLKKGLLVLGAMILSVQMGFADNSTAVQNPADFVQSTVNALQQQISKGGKGLANNPQKLFGVLKQTVMPYVAIDQMAGLALGPKWRNATPAQQQQFINEFGQLLTTTYANALVSISNYKITISPMRGTAWKTSQYASVNGQVVSGSNGKSSSITYYLQRSGTSWQIYDLAIEGVSFLQNYQNQFQSFPDMASLLTKLDAMTNS